MKVYFLTKNQILQGLSTILIAFKKDGGLKPKLDKPEPIKGILG